MIKINLAVLLAERGLKITELSKQTGISRPTLTALYYNQSKGIQFDTLDSLCDHLKVKPDKLILHERFTYEFECEILEALSHYPEGGDGILANCNCKITYNSKQVQNLFRLECSFNLTGYDTDGTVDRLSIYGQLPDEIEDILNSIPQLVKTDFFNDLKHEISFVFSKQFPITDDTEISLSIS